MLTPDGRPRPRVSVSPPLLGDSRLSLALAQREAGSREAPSLAISGPGGELLIYFDLEPRRLSLALAQ